MVREETVFIAKALYAVPPETPYEEYYVYIVPSIYLGDVGWDVPEGETL